MYIIYLIGYILGVCAKKNHSTYITDYNSVTAIILESATYYLFSMQTYVETNRWCTDTSTL